MIRVGDKLTKSHFNVKTNVVLLNWDHFVRGESAEMSLATVALPGTNHQSTSSDSNELITVDQHHRPMKINNCFISSNRQHVALHHRLLCSY